MVLFFHPDQKGSLLKRILYEESALMEIFRLLPGSSPLLISVPHAGLYVPPEIRARMEDYALCLPDTDRHVDRLYDFAQELGAWILIATHNRYVIDLNRPTDGTVLYPGENNTELVPLTDFDLQPIYRSGQAPDLTEQQVRIQKYWQPYHDCLRQTLAAIRDQYGLALLYDAHSIPAEVPRFFEGRLADLNLGSADGQAACPELVARLSHVCHQTEAYSAVVDGRFKGGYITRTYGDPAHHIHAVQMELVQATYMEEKGARPYRTDLAASIQPVLRTLLVSMLEWAKEKTA